MLAVGTKKYFIVKPLFQGVLEGKDLVSIAELYDNPLEWKNHTRSKMTDPGVLPKRHWPAVRCVKSWPLG